MSAQPRWLDIDDDFLGPPQPVYDNTPGMIRDNKAKTLARLKKLRQEADEEYKVAKQRHRNMKAYIKNCKQDCKDEYKEAMEAYNNMKKE